MSQTIVLGDFEWSREKAKSNVKKHGITFVEALEAFADDQAIEAPDLAVPGRFILIGYSRANRILFVVWAERGPRIRIISARKASPKQRKAYQDGNEG
jgi:uncharacterized protein